VAALASAGAAVEWYDFFLYGTAAALIFPKLFFPSDMPPFIAQIASFSTFMVGFIARPLGASIFGHCDYQGVLPTAEVAKMTEDRRPQWPCDEANHKSTERSNLRDKRRHI
jgi:hypothetical protein